MGLIVDNLAAASARALAQQRQFVFRVAPSIAELVSQVGGALRLQTGARRAFIACAAIA